MLIYIFQRKTLYFYQIIEQNIKKKISVINKILQNIVKFEYKSLRPIQTYISKNCT
jgi:hypothetical protein